jgi:hypothetical protein
VPFESQTVSPDNLTDFLAQARERHSFGMSFDKDDRNEAAFDVRFASGDQWDKAAKDQRYKAKRPCLTENRLPVYIAQVVNDGRQNKPAIRVTPMDDGTPETAEYFQGRIRHIEYESDGDIAYDTSREQQVVSGRGYYRVLTEYEKGSTERQQICIRPIENQFSVVEDPAAERYDRTDAEWKFVSCTLSKAAFKRKYPNSEATATNFWNGVENPAPDWIGIGNGDLVQVAEYWVRDGEKVCQYVINGAEILEETEWIGSVIPIIPVWGRYQMIDGKRRTFSLIRNARDPQKLINLYVSNIAEQIAQMPKSPYIAAEGQITGREAEWADANNTPRAVLLYKPVAIGGQVAPPPQRIINEPPIQALAIGLTQAIDAVKAAMGIFDASLGNRSNETSGLAIQRRQKEADNANFHFHDNESRSRKALGRILLELIPKVDAGRDKAPVQTEDGKTQLIPLGVPHRDEKTGNVVMHDLSRGNYGVAISTGPSYTSQRQEAFDMYSQIASADKNFMAVAGDILFRSMDAPGSEQVAERYEKTLPPQLQPQKPGGPQIPPQAQAALAQAQQHMMALNEYAKQLEGKVQELEQAQQAKVIEIEGRKDIERMKIEAQLTVAEVNTKAQMLGERMTLVMDMLKQLNVQAHEAGMQAQQQAHERDQAQMAQEAAQQQPDEQQAA